MSIRVPGRVDTKDFVLKISCYTLVRGQMSVGLDVEDWTSSGPYDDGQFCANPSNGPA